MKALIHVEVDKGTEERPTFIRISFTPESVNFIIGQSRRFTPPHVSEEEVEALEVRGAIEDLTHWFHQELERAIKTQLKISC